jgi:hypothetical protein
MFKHERESSAVDIEKTSDLKKEDRPTTSLPSSHLNPTLDLGTTVIISKPVSAKYEGTALIPKEQNKIDQGSWSFSVNPTLVTFDSNCHSYRDTKKLDSHCKAQGSLFNINLRLETPVGALNHEMSFGGLDTSIGAHVIPDFDDNQGGVGINRALQLDLINSRYDYQSPVFCQNDMGIELMAGISAVWGWKLENKLDLSLTTLTLPIEVNLPAPWGTQLNIGGYASLIRTPRHPQCISLNEKKEITKLSNLQEPKKLLFGDDKDQRQFTVLDKPNIPLFHQSFFKTSKEMNGSTLGTITPSPFLSQKNKSNFLNETYQSKENPKATKLLLHPKETSFLQTDYLSSERQVAARKLSNSGVNHRSFFNPEKTEKNTQIIPEQLGILGKY